MFGLTVLSPICRRGSGPDIVNPVEACINVKAEETSGA